MKIDVNEPSEFGEIEFVLPIAPISTQAKSNLRANITQTVQQVTQPLNFVFTGDIGIEIEWMVPALLRYESDVSPDLDNITKPLIDALCGPNGVLIDDCQVKSFGSEWIDWMRDDQQVIIRVRYAPDEWTFKKDLFFVQIDKGLCVPIEGGLASPQLKILLSAYQVAIAARKQLLNMGVRDSIARAILPTHRIFHRTRIHGYKVVTIESLK